jgi:hypothetical protein
MHQKNIWQQIFYCILSVYLHPAFSMHFRNCSHEDLLSRHRYSLCVYHEVEPFAFNSFKLASKDTISNSACPTSQEIIITGIDSFCLRQKIERYFGIYLSKDIVFGYRHIEYWVRQLKISGFFTYVNADIYYFSKHQVIRIDLKVNPVLGQVSVANCHNRLISVFHVYALFKGQLGYPQNFAQINHAISKIAQWYHSRGYEWIKVRVEPDVKDYSHIILHISEGVINNVKMLGYAKKNKYDNLGPDISLNYILSVLNLKSGQRLNRKDLDNGISILKNQRFFSSCSYDVLRTRTTKDELDLTLHVEAFSAKSTSLFSKKITIISNILESLEQLLFDHINPRTIFQEATSRYVTHNTSINNQYLSSLYLKISKNDLFVYPSLSYQIYANLYRVQEWYLAPLIFIAGDNFGFKHIVRNIGLHKHSATLSAQFPRTGHSFNFMYDLPRPSVFGGKHANACIKLFKNTYLYQQKQKPILLDYSNYKYFCYKNSVLYQQGLQLDLNYYLNQGFILYNNVNIRQISSQHILLKNRIPWRNLAYKREAPDLGVLCSQLKQIWVYNTQQFISLQCLLTYPKVSKAKKLSSHSRFSIESIYYVPNPFAKLCFGSINGVNYSRRLKLKLRHVFSLFFHFIACKIEFVASPGTKSYVPFSESFIIVGPETIRAYKEEVFSFPTRFVKLNIEYHIPLNEQNTLFCFTDYIYNFDYVSSIKNGNNLLLPQYSLNEFKLRVGYGLGLKIHIPVKQIPTLRIEYGYNIENKSCFHLRVES